MIECAHPNRGHGEDHLSRRNCPSAFLNPHTRGGEPFDQMYGADRLPSSPHAWGCTASRPLDADWEMIFPMRVGVNRMLSFQQSAFPNLPYMRRGVPDFVFDRMAERNVFPTRVGVDLSKAVAIC